MKEYLKSCGYCALATCFLCVVLIFIYGPAMLMLNYSYWFALLYFIPASLIFHQMRVRGCNR